TESNGRDEVENDDGEIEAGEGEEFGLKEECEGGCNRLHLHMLFGLRRRCQGWGGFGSSGVAVLIEKEKLGSFRHFEDWCCDRFRSRQSGSSVASRSIPIIDVYSSLFLVWIHKSHSRSGRKPQLFRLYSGGAAPSQPPKH